MQDFYLFNAHRHGQTSSSITQDGGRLPRRFHHHHRHGVFISTGVVRPGRSRQRGNDQPLRRAIPQTTSPAKRLAPSALSRAKPNPESTMNMLAQINAEAITYIQARLKTSASISSEQNCPSFVISEWFAITSKSCEPGVENP
jgi:hypothetical protein